MGAASIATTGKANRGAAAHFIRSGSKLHFSRGIPRIARLIWPEKTAAELALRTNTTERACREILAKRAIFSTRALVALLQSEEGFPFLKELMGTHKPAWWTWAERAVHLGKMRRQLERQRKAIEQYELALAEESNGSNDED